MGGHGLDSSGSGYRQETRSFEYGKRNFGYHNLRELD